MALKMLVIALVASLLAINSANAILINIQNLCGQTLTVCAQSGQNPVFPYVLSANGGFQQLNVGGSWPSAAVWGFPGTSGSAATCSQARAEADLAEFNLPGAGGTDFYDISNVNAYNLPLRISPSTGGCTTISCTINNLNSFCQPPNSLTGPPGDGCYNANGPTSNNPTPGTIPFKKACPDAFSYTTDFTNTLYTCAGGGNYAVTFCPGNAEIRQVVSEATS